MGLLKIFFTILLIIFPFGELGRIQLSKDIAITVNDIIVGFLILYWIFYHLIKREKIKGKYLAKPIFIFAAIALLSLILNSKYLNLGQFFVSFLYLLRWIFYALLYFVVCEFDKPFKKKIIYFMIFQGAMIVLAGYIQYFFYPNLRNLYYAGWDEHLYRMFSSFLDPNFLGVFLGLFFIFILGLLFSYIKNTRGILGLTALGFIILGAVFLTYSRSALVALFIGTAVFLIIKSKKVFIFWFLILILGAIFFLPRAFKTEGTNFLRVASIDARLESINNAFTIFRRNSILGVGFDAYRFAQERYGYIKSSSQFPSHSASGTDNSFLFLLATTGILGFISYMFIWFKILVKAKHRLRTDVISVILFSSSVSLFIDSFFINSLFYIFIMEWMWILIGLAE